MRKALFSLLSSIAVAVMVFFAPMSALAAEVPFYFGGAFGNAADALLPCTGFFNLTVESSVPDPNSPAGSSTMITKTEHFQPVSDTATNGKQPCRSLCDVFVLINNLIRLAVSVLVSVFTPIMIIIGGFMVMTSGGNPGQRSTGKKIITGTLGGLALTICSALIVSQMMTFVFQKAWGQALKDQLTYNIQHPLGPSTTGLTEDKIPDFAWNTLSCDRSGPGGGVTVTPSTTTIQPPKVPPTSTNACAKAGGICFSSNDTVAKCGGTVTTASCPQKGQKCCTVTPGHACIKACSDQGKVWKGGVTKDGANCICVNAR